MNTKDLEEQLERLGRAPAPAPRRQFVEELLTRIQLSAEDEDVDVIVPAPVPLADRRSLMRLRLVTALSMAAALAVAVGLYGLLRDSDGTRRVLTASMTEGSQTVEVLADGTIVGGTDDGQTRDVIATCQSHARIEVAGQPFECHKNDKIELTIEGGKVVEAKLVPIPEVQVAMAPTTTPTTAPGSSPALVPVPGSNPPGDPLTTTTTALSVAPTTNAAPPGVAPQTTTTQAPQAPAPSQLNPSGAGTPVPPSATFKLTHAAGGGSLSLSWPAWTGSSFGRYAILQTISGDPARQPDTPLWAGPGAPEELASVSPAASTTYTRPLDGSAGLPVDTPLVSYRVAVLGPNGELLGLSETLTLQLRWSLKVSDTSTTSTTLPAEVVSEGRADKGSNPMKQRSPRTAGG